MKSKTYIGVVLEVRWRLGRGALEAVDDTLFALLAAVVKGGSLRVAAQGVGVSYRHAWGLLARWEAALGSPLVRLERGRGARLTRLGAALLTARDGAAEAVAPTLRRLAADAARELAAALPGGTPPALSVCASHSLAMEVLRDLAAGQGTPLNLHVCGSVEALRQWHAGACDLAGFHVPAGRGQARLLPHYRRWLDPQGHCLIRVVSRRQGLMRAPGNPMGIATLADLCRPGVRFINRQPESGTRLLLDDLLAREGVDPARIDGYASEEFTHMAVAAMVASGAADAGFGIAAAAQRFGLEFVPMARERYYLAARRHDLDGPAVAALCALLGGRPFRERVAAMSGYDPAGSGKVVEVADVFPD
ncbi:MAG: helix-turn-helix transcriptional regulator [Nitrospirae bacterium]|nr:helix-turn-helix transcriptional regulator [Nitrospirota bacterium]